MCTPLPGPRCPADTRARAQEALHAYECAFPAGPPVDPLHRARTWGGADLLRATRTTDGVSLEQAEAYAGMQVWIETAALSPEACEDLGLWLSGPSFHTSDRTGSRTRRYSPTWREGDLVLTQRGSRIIVERADGSSRLEVGEMSEDEAAEFGEWLLEPSIRSARV